MATNKQMSKAMNGIIDILAKNGIVADEGIALLEILKYRIVKKLDNKGQESV